MSEWWPEEDAEWKPPAAEMHIKMTGNFFYKVVITNKVDPARTRPTVLRGFSIDKLWNRALGVAECEAKEWNESVGR